ncbi:MAG: DUF3320 domain-containing protein [Erythrobacter sp.]|nr:MAG: DUF3320 domain-containing protein [Erythrobacter sp.]
MQVDVAEKIGFVSQQNAVPPLRGISITNERDESIEKAVLTLETDPGFLAPRTWQIDHIAAGETLHILDQRVNISASYTKGLSESERGTISLKLCDQDGQLLALHDAPTKLLASDQWGGTDAMPELLAAFVMPNDPAVDKVLKAASDALRRAGRPSGIDGYESGDRTRVYECASAIWTAVAGLKLSYALPPASFERSGQKVRTPRAIFDGRIATCLDTALLFAAALEQARLNPLIVLTEGHAFVGCWLQPQEFAQLVTDEVGIVRTRIDLNELLLFETTLVADHPPARFSQAVDEGRRQVSELSGEDLFVALDIRRARMQKLLPLATISDKHEPGDDDIEAGLAVEVAPSNIPKAFDLSHIDEQEDDPTEDRIVDWQRKLLDLTARNRLLNLPKSGSVLSLVCPQPGRLEDLLADGKDLRVKPLPDLAIGGRDIELHRQRSREDLKSEHAAAGLERLEVYAELEKQKLDATLIKLYRSAKSDLEEGGANTLYLALGFLDWKKDVGDARSYRAPLILLPVSLKRSSARADMKLAAHPDDARFNMTLLELLKTDFGLVIGGLDGDLPTDESGIDVPGIWNHIRHAIKDSPGFEVREDVVLGIFSFSKYLMWKDLVDRADQLKENAVVRHLIERGTKKFNGGGGLPEMARPETLDRDVDLSDLYAPLPADSSQLAAVVASGQGHNFVLDGPPGTGKSQTIANMVAHNLALGRRVLFVSEKRAALDVVYRRLETVGLGDFCLELHSHKSSKAEVLRQLGEAWDAKGALSTEEWQHETSRLTLLRDELNGFTQALHKVHSNGLTIHDAIWRSVAHRDKAVPTLRWPARTEHSRDQLDQMADLVRRVELTHLDLETLPQTVLASVSASEWNNAFQARLITATQSLQSATLNYQTAANAAQSASNLPLPATSPEAASTLSKVLSALCKAGGANVGFAFAPDANATISAVDQYADVLRQYHAEIAQLSVAYAEDSERTVNHEDLAAQWAAAADKFWFFETLARGKVAKELARLGGTPARPDPENDLPVLARLAALRERLDAIAPGLSPLPGLASRDSDPAKLEELARTARAIKGLVAAHADGVDDFARLNQAVRSLVVDANDMLQLGGAIALASEKLEIAGTDWSDKLRTFAEVSGSSPVGENFESLTESLQAIIDCQQSMRGICQWNAAKAEVEQVGLSEFADLVEAGLPNGDAVPLFETAYARWFATWAIDDEPVLANFNAHIHEETIARFREHTERVQDLTVGIVRARLCSNIPGKDDVARSSGYGILKHELTKQRRHKPVRQLAEEMGGDFNSLAPCMLMSPLSIAQYLPATQDLFDIVIFDEASQITPWDAVGSIARGKQLVLAGDDKQMPPTNFFSKGTASVADDSDIIDLDSILEECQGAGIPKRSLDWHYRSRHDSLIAFSNSRYYKNKLVTFPPPQTRESAVEWKRVESVYAKGAGQTNTGEAKAIVDEVKQRLKGVLPGQETLGIVTLNSQQQELVLDLLETARTGDSAFDAHFSDDLEEPVFVKNLETVQGDERDIIILGTTFGPTEPGSQKMSMNFGPLNREGGERRLNVAVTRARKEMVLFTSFDPGMIDLSRTGSNAIRDLKHYIEFAAKGPRALAEAHQGSIGVTESPFEDAVKLALERRGWTVRPQIGVSGFRIDLGVVHPDRPGDYLAGIECDGAMYHSALTARDRDQVRQAVLEGLNWKIIRIWSTDFWVNAERAMEVVQERLNALLEADRERVISEAEAADAAPESEGANDDSSALFVGDDESSGTAEPTAFSGDRQSEEGSWTSNEAPVKPPISEDKSGTTNPLAGGKEPYRHTDFEHISGRIKPDLFAEPEYSQVIAEMIKHAVETEAPIEKSALATVIARAHGFKRTGSLIAERVEKIGRKLFHYRQERSGRIFVWRDEAHCDALTTWREPSDEDRKRPIEDIPEEEIILAARDFPFDDDVPRAIAVAFGFSRLRAPSRERIEEALQTHGDSIDSANAEEPELEVAAAQFAIASRVTESEVQQEILSLLADGNPWTNGELKSALKALLPLSPADRERANHRPNEEKWEELVNNALSPSRGNSLYGKGLIENVDRGVHRRRS